MMLLHGTNVKKKYTVIFMGYTRNAINLLIGKALEELQLRVNFLKTFLQWRTPAKTSANSANKKIIT